MVPVFFVATWKKYIEFFSNANVYDLQTVAISSAARPRRNTPKAAKPTLIQSDKVAPLHDAQ